MASGCVDARLKGEARSVFRQGSCLALHSEHLSGFIGNEVVPSVSAMWRTHGVAVFDERRHALQLHHRALTVAVCFHIPLAVSLIPVERKPFF